MSEWDKFPKHWPEGLEPMSAYVGRSDDSPDDVLILTVSEDGDAFIRTRDMERQGPSVRICTHAGGGRQSRTRLALLWLALAMKLDAEEAAGKGGAK